MIYPFLMTAAGSAPETTTSLAHWLVMLAVTMSTSAGAIAWIYVDRTPKVDPDN
jgi:hypothetical protein